MPLQDLILESHNLPEPVPVPTPEWTAADGKVFVARATTADLAAFWSWFADQAKDGDALAPWAACWFACDSAGKPLFDRTAETARRLAGKAGCVISRIFHQADDLNYLTEASRERLPKKLDGWRVRCHLQLAWQFGLASRSELYRQYPDPRDLIEAEEAWRKYRWGPEQFTYLAAQIVDAIQFGRTGQSRPLEDLLLKFGTAEEAKAERLKRARENLDRMNASKRRI